MVLDAEGGEGGDQSGDDLGGSMGGIAFNNMERAQLEGPRKLIVTRSGPRRRGKMGKDCRRFRAKKKGGRGGERELVVINGS